VKVLLTGSEGFIGGHLRKELETHGHPVAGIDLARGQTHDLLYEPTIRHYLDVVKPDVCIHLAAKVGRLFGEDDIRKTIEDNAWMTANVAKACGERGVRLMYASTSEVYGDRGEHVCLEDEPFVGVPHNIYGLSKSVGAKRHVVYTHLKTLLSCALVCLMGTVSLLEGAALLSSTSSIPLFILSLSLFIVGVSVLGVGLGILLERRGSSSKADTRGRTT
jgi:dTDP-4-dehydrorhamnose reductase